MVKKQAPPSIHELFNIAVTEFDKSVTLWDIRNYDPYGAQLPFHQSTATGRVLTAGNRAGKTDSMIVEFIWTATNTHPYQPRPAKWGIGPVQLRIIVVDVTKGVEGIMLPKFKRWMTREMMVDGSWEKSWNNQDLILTFSNGSTIDFLTYGMTLEKHGGVPRHMIGFDEEPPREIFNEAMMRLLDYEGRWVIAATPVNGIDWIYDSLVEPSREGVIPLDYCSVFELSTDDNPYLLSEDRERYLLGMDAEERSIREEGKYVSKGGLVFPKFKDNLNRYLVDPVDVKSLLAQGWRLYATVDHGFKAPTAWLWIIVSPRGQCIVVSEHYQDQMIIRDHARIVKEREASWGVSSIDVIRSGDPAMLQRQGVTGVSIIQTYALEGVYISVEGIPRDVMPGVEKLQAYLQLPENPEHPPRLQVSRNCPNLIRELKKLRWETYDSAKSNYQKNPQEVIHKKDDHAADSLRYWATLMPDPTPEYIPTDKEPLTIGYAEMLSLMRQDDTITFAEDLAERPEQDPSEWVTSEAYGDY